MMFDKAQRELSVFEAFSSTAKLDLTEGSVESRDPPEPDIRCLISDSHRAFELTEVVDQSRVRAGKVMHKGIREFESLVAGLPPDHPLITDFSDAGFQVTFHRNATESACSKASAALIKHLVQDQSILRIGNREFVQIPSTKPLNAINYVNMTRGYPNGPSITASSGGAVSIPIIESVEAKFAKTYETDATIDLLVYFDKYRSLDEARWIPQLRARVEFDLNDSQFDRVWVYDHHDRRLIWDSENGDST